MPDPSPQLVDTIARAIYDDQHGDSPLSLSWDDAIAASRSDRHDAGLHGIEIASARRAARAALAAMPEPVGYALLEDLPPEGDLPRDTYLREWVYRTPAEADSYNDTDNTRVVALVPAGDDHA